MPENQHTYIDEAHSIPISEIVHIAERLRVTHESKPEDRAVQSVMAEISKVSDYARNLLTNAGMKLTPNDFHFDEFFTKTLNDQLGPFTGRSLNTSLRELEPKSRTDIFPEIIGLVDDIRPKIKIAALDMDPDFFRDYFSMMNLRHYFRLIVEVIFANRTKRGQPADQEENVLEKLENAAKAIDLDMNELLYFLNGKSPNPFAARKIYEWMCKNMNNICSKMEGVQLDDCRMLALTDYLHAFDQGYDHKQYNPYWREISLMPSEYYNALVTQWESDRKLVKEQKSKLGWR
jgi:hypothetical protein